MIAVVFIVMIIAVALLCGIFLGYFGETGWLFWCGALAFAVIALIIKEVNVLSSGAFLVTGLVSMVVTMKIKQAEEGK